MEFGGLVWFLFAIFTAVVANNKGRNVFGWFILGFFFGPFALIFVLVLPYNQSRVKVCPYCAEKIKEEAIKCKHCGSSIEPQASSSGNFDFDKSEHIRRQSANMRKYGS